MSGERRNLSRALDRTERRNGVRVIFKDATSGQSRISTAPLRRFGASSLARMLVLAVGLSAMTAYTVPDLADRGRRLARCLPVVLSRAISRSTAAIRARAAISAGDARAHISLAVGLSSIWLGVVAVPVALACGVQRRRRHGCWRRCGSSSSRRIRPASRSSAACSCSRQSRWRACWRCF